MNSLTGLSVPGELMHALTLFAGRTFDVMPFFVKVCMCVIITNNLGALQNAFDPPLHGDLNSTGQSHSTAMHPV